MFDRFFGADEVEAFTDLLLLIVAVSGKASNRLRYCIWKAWKKPERKRKNLIRLGVAPQMAYAWSRMRKGGWAIAQSPILTSTITLVQLAKRGYESMEEHYLKICPWFNEPLYT